MNRKIVLAASLAASIACMSSPAFSQAADAWRFRATLYGYLPDIGGSTKFPASGGGSNVSLDSGTVLDNLQGVFMGAFEAHQGRWGMFTDVMYMNLGATRSGFRDFTIGGTALPGSATASATYDLKGWLWTVGGAWRVASTPASTVDVVAGARMLDIEQSLDWQVTGDLGSISLPGRAGNARTSLTNWDAIVGVKGRLAFGEGQRWFVPYYFDVGTGDSSLTWQAMAGLGYSFKWGDIVAAWRYIDYDMKSGESLENIDFNGPAIAASFRW